VSRSPSLLAAADNQTVVLRPVMWMFIALLCTFVITRAITRRIRARTAAAEEQTGVGFRDVMIGGVHIHHQVWGIVIMLGAGLALIAGTPEGTALDVVGAIFGVGVSLTFDEFALWLHLEDVYWTTDGRKSVDAIFAVLAVTGILIGGADFVSGTIGSGEWWGSVLGLIISLVLSVICLLKGKMVPGVVGVVFSVIAVVGAIRLAKPDSWWGRRRYTRRPRRMARAQRRFGESYQARWNRIRDLIAGAPSRQPVRSPRGP
jgi:hypothetical protein